MKNLNVCLLGLSLMAVSSVYANVGDKIQNRCQIISAIEKNELAQYNNIKLPYQTLLTTLDCEKSMAVTGGITITSPFSLTLSLKLKSELEQLIASNQKIDVSFIDDAYAVKPEQIGNLKNFPDPREQSYRVRGGNTYAFEKETAYEYLDKVLNFTGAVEVPKAALNYKDPNDTRLSWDKTFHLLTVNGDFEITIAQEGPHFFRAWQIPSVSVKVAYILTSQERNHGLDTPHQLSSRDSLVLQKALGKQFYSTGNKQSKVSINCTQDICSVQIL